MNSTLDGRLLRKTEIALRLVMKSKKKKKLNMHGCHKKVVESVNYILGY